MAACGSNDPAQTWTLYANGSLTPVSNPGSSLTTCTDGNPACDAKIEQLASNNGELVAIAYEQTPQTWEETPPSKVQCINMSKCWCAMCKSFLKNACFACMIMFPTRTCQCPGLSLNVHVLVLCTTALLLSCTDPNLRQVVTGQQLLCSGQISWLGVSFGD